MRSFAIVAALAVFMPVSLYSQTSIAGTAPNYSTQSIVNCATQTVEALAPNTIATIYGTNLSFSTRAVAGTDIVGGLMPVSLAGVGVWVNGIASSLFYVSSNQINFVVPYQLTPGTVTVVVARDSVAGPEVSIQLSSTSPGLFLWNVNNAVAVHLNSQLISAASPATPGEIIVLFAGGLGRTSPDTTNGKLATSAFSIYYLSQLQILFNGSPAPPGTVLYAGLAPGFAGLYQINVKLPLDLSANPQIQVAVGSQISPASIQLYVN